MQTALARVTRLVSNRKAYAAALTPLILALGTTLSNWISSGVFDTTELQIAGSGLAVAVTTGLVTWLQDAGEAEVEIIPGSLEDAGDGDLPPSDTWEVEEPEDAPPPTVIAPKSVAPPTL
jgi:hypothetical protein